MKCRHNLSVRIIDATAKKKVVCIILLIIFMTSFSFTTYAVTPENFRPNKNEQLPEELTKAGGQILWVVQLIGYGVAVITLTIIGIKYMLSSIDERADIKKRLIPFTIGAFIFFGGSFILSIISMIAKILPE